MSGLSRFTTKKSKKKERIVESSLCCGSYSAPFIHSLLSSLAVEGKGRPREKPDFPRHPPRVTNAISRNVLDIQCYGNAPLKDLTNTGCVADEIKYAYPVVQSPLGEEA